jgi:long-subunit acyl-CoA synthetase (AMP-forming)
VISYLPHAHVADRFGTHYFAMMIGGTTTACPDPKLLFEHAMEVKPTEFTGVPRVWEKLKAGIEAKLGADPVKGAMAKAAIDAAIAKVRLEQANQPVPEALAAGVARAEQMVFGPLRAMLGLGEARTFFVGAAPSTREVLEFFHALGMPICEVWGMSELSCVATAMPLGVNRIGSVGKALPGIELRVAEDGELLVRGPVVMRGYRNKPEQTRETIVDGWLHTGDVATIDADGFVRIVDRKKELIISAGGKNMSPANIEAQVKSSSPLIGQAAVVGDMRPYNVALLVLEPEGAMAFCRARGIDLPLAQLVEHDGLRAEIAAAIERANGQLSRVEQVKKWTLLGAEWLPGGDELTPTMKLKRKAIATKYAAAIASMYADSD